MRTIRTIKPAVSYTAAEASEATGIGLSRIREALADGTLPKHYLGKTPLILAGDLTAFVAALPSERVS